jgi:glyoxylase-like metal-dependent hydrolase (beta-lactamase superfamily II)
MHATPVIARRTFVADLGKGAFAIAVLGLAGCAPAATGSAGPSASARASTSAAAGGGGGDGYGGGHGDASGSAAPTSAGGSSAPPAGGSLAWSRVNLGFVSAYVLVRGGEAAIVDTGTAGSEGAIGEALGAVGLDWGAVGHVVLTHHHGDHAGSAAAVLGLAPDAAGYAGAEDIPAITVPRTLEAVGDGDRVFGLEVVTAPGHTAGSICVLDPEASVLVAGDALRVEGGAPALPGAQFTDDMDQALVSVAKLGALTFETLLVGHGEPLEGGASAAVAKLAAGS